MHGFRLAVSLILALLFWTSAVQADQGYPYPQMQVQDSAKGFDALVADLKAAVSVHKMGLVTQACGSCGAKAQGFDIPGNFVAGVFRNDFARRLFAAHVEAGIEAPMRFYITELPDGRARLTYRLPSAILAAYDVPALVEIGQELDALFAAIAADAVR